METIQAGSSTNQKRSMVGALIVALLLLAGVASAQTGQALGGPKFTAQLNNGDPCNGCKLFAYVGGTTTKQDTYTTSALSVANANPVVLDSAGRATVFLDPTKIYKFVLAPSTDTDPPSAALWTMDNVTGQFAGVVTVTAANTRGIQITRSGANAGLSVASSGGSGKTYGLVSDTTGAGCWQDDADSTPRVCLSANDIILTATGTISVPTGLASFGGFGAHLFSTGGTGANSLTIRNTSSGTGNYADLILANDASAGAFRITQTASNYTASGPYQQDASIVNGFRSGGLSLSAGHASGDVRIYAGGLTSPSVTVDDTGLTTITNLQSTIHKSGTAQPGFLAYNSASDSVGTGATVDFDTEVYDTASNFASDTFTAPQAGVYEFCAGVTFNDNASSSFAIFLNQPGILYPIYQAAAVTSGSGSGCIFVSLANGEAMSVYITTTDAAATIEGVSGSARQTWFSGRLMP